jgi:hypothetical protein
MVTERLALTAMAVVESAVADRDADFWADIPGSEKLKPIQAHVALHSTRASPVSPYGVCSVVSIAGRETLLLLAFGTQCATRLLAVRQADS